MKTFFFIIFIPALLLSGCSIIKAPQTINTNEIKTPDSVTPSDDVPKKENQQISKKLDLSSQNLDRIPEYIFGLKNLEELDVSDNKLTGAIQAEIRNLQNLKILNASFNQMTGVPAEIGQLSNLEILNLSNNQLTGLPYELGNLQKLKIFNISENDYSELDLKIITEKLPQNVDIIK